MSWLASVEALEFVANYLGIDNAYEVASFYNMVDLKPVGKHKRQQTNLPWLSYGVGQGEYLKKNYADSYNLDHARWQVLHQGSASK